MKAMVYHNYGSPDNLELQEVEMPAVKDGAVGDRSEQGKTC
jgi:NADPH:quinone reductase-like Zn-dependent oxidoreductase